MTKQGLTQVMSSKSGGPWISARASPSCHFRAPDQILCFGGEAQMADGSLEPISAAVAVDLPHSPPSMELKAGHERGLRSLLKGRQDPGEPYRSLLQHNVIQTR